jgi:hypothetical protein
VGTYYLSTHYFGIFPFFCSEIIFRMKICNCQKCFLIFEICPKAISIPKIMADNQTKISNASYNKKMEICRNNASTNNMFPRIMHACLFFQIILLISKNVSKMKSMIFNFVEQHAENTLEKIINIQGSLVLNHFLSVWFFRKFPKLNDKETKREDPPNINKVI